MGLNKIKSAYALTGLKLMVLESNFIGLCPTLVLLPFQGILFSTCESETLFHELTMKITLIKLLKNSNFD